ncbi:MAG TPA: hypothetical protein VGP36_04105 [Mycobacteriales bacterium]|nr:hypothetical protein [Mycobacteriales bacterium]
MTPPYAAELRVYEPLAAFDVEERRRWQQYAQAPAVPSGQAGARRERIFGLVAACRQAPAVPRAGDAGEHAAVLRGESGLLICPLRTELRCWEAAAETRDALPPEVARAVLPESEVAVASAEHQRWLAEHPTRRSHVQASRWTVPVRWFVLFDREERRLQLGPTADFDPGLGYGVEFGSTAEGVTVSRSLVYRTAMSQARRRVAKALQVLRKSMPDAPTLDSVEVLGRWLEEFHPRSLVELDYLGLVDLCADAELRNDDSAGDVAEALAALQVGDTKLASEAYDRVTERWRIAYSAESAN